MQSGCFFPLSWIYKEKGGAFNTQKSIDRARVIRIKQPIVVWIVAFLSIENEARIGWLGADVRRVPIFDEMASLK